MNKSTRKTTICHFYTTTDMSGLKWSFIAGSKIALSKIIFPLEYYTNVIGEFSNNSRCYLLPIGISNDINNYNYGKDLGANSATQITTSGQYEFWKSTPTGFWKTE